MGLHAHPCVYAGSGVIGTDDLLEFFSPNSKLKVDRYNLDEHVLLVIDDFLCDPEAVTHLAGQLDYGLDRQPDSQFQRYPGERARVSLYPEETYAAILNTYRLEGGRPAPLVSYARNSLVFTRIDDDALEELDARQVVPHVDAGIDVIAIVYLSAAEVGGGTAFYRHRATGLAHLPTHPSFDIARMMREAGFDPLKREDYTRFTKALMYSELDAVSVASGETGISESTAMWEVLRIVPLAYNRLIIFPACVFHSPIYTRREGEDLAQRLTLNVFFTRA